MPSSVLQLVNLYTAWSNSASSVCEQWLVSANKGDPQYLNFCWDHNSAVGSLFVNNLIFPVCYGFGGYHYFVQSVNLG